MSVTTQSTTLASVPGGGAYAFDKVGAAAAPAANDLIQYVKLDQGAAGASSPVSNSNPLVVADPTPIFHGRASTFRTAGRAGTAGQKIMSLYNAAASPVTAIVEQVVIDLYQTVVKAVTVPPPVIRLWLVTAAPTNGSSLTKNKIGGSGASSASVTVLGDASADGTGSATTLTATLPAGAIVTQEFAPRLITAAGYEMFDRTEFLREGEVELPAASGLVLFLDYTAATQNPTTDMWMASMQWREK